MSYLFNFVYVGVLVLLSPWLLWKAATTGRYRRGLGQKLTGKVKVPAPTGIRVWFHGVSVGEIHLLRHVIKACRESHPEWHIVVSTTTDTGHDEASKIFADLPVVYWPFDFSWAVAKAIDGIKPDLIVLAESELWPNFLREAERCGIPVVVINARMSPRSAARLSRLGPLAKMLLGKVSAFAAQTEEYAEAYRRLGARAVVVTGSVKYDGAQTRRDNPRTVAMRSLFQIHAGDLVWVAGSTQSPEESVCLELFQFARTRFPTLRLILVPRQKDRFDEVAHCIEKAGLPFARRSRIGESTSVPIILVDTIGELGAIWGLADVAFVGGSLDGQRGGQNMIEPAAYGAAVVFGPHTWNFKETVARLLKCGGAREVADVKELEDAIVALLDDADLRAKLGSAASEFVRSQQGATQRTIAVLESFVSPIHALEAA